MRVPVGHKGPVWIRIVAPALSPEPVPMHSEVHPLEHLSSFIKVQQAQIFRIDQLQDLEPRRLGRLRIRFL